MQKGGFSHSYEKFFLVFFVKGLMYFYPLVRPQLGPWSNISLAHEY